MKTLKEYVNESLFGVDNVSGKKLTRDYMKGMEKEVEEFIKNNYVCTNKLKIKFNKAIGKVLVDSMNGGLISLKSNATSLTNDMFEWGRVMGSVHISYNRNIKSLHGLPKIIEGDLDIQGCDLLESLEGSPQEVGTYRIYDCQKIKTLDGCTQKCAEFMITDCHSLTNLVGGPQDVGRYTCRNCNALKSLKDAPKIMAFPGAFIIIGCNALKNLEDSPQQNVVTYEVNANDSLESLKGVPKEVKFRFACNLCPNLYSLEYSPKTVKNFECRGCGGKFDEDDVRRECEVLDRITV